MLIIIIPVVLLLVGFLMYRMYQNPVLTMKDLKTYKTAHLRRLIPQEFEFSTQKVTTKDGYILQIVNIRHKKNYNKAHPPVLIQHGNIASCADFLTNSPHLCAPLILAKLG